jgi:hypothetical protein
MAGVVVGVVVVTGTTGAGVVVGRAEVVLT